MTNVDLLSSAPPDKHLSAAEMYDYIENNLPAPTRHRVEAHLLQCDLCTEALNGLMLIPKDSALPHLVELNIRVKTRTSRRKPNTTLRDIKNWGFVTGILFLVIFAAIMVWFEARKETFLNGNQKPKTSLISDKPAVPVTGFSAYEKYIAAHKVKIIISETDQNITVSFIVNPNSALTGFSIVPAQDTKTTKALIALIKNGPRWEPATNADNAISQRVWVKVPVPLGQ